VSWREALFELIQYGLDQGFSLMMSLGGPLDDNRSANETGVPVMEGGVPGDPSETEPWNELQSWYSNIADRIPGAQDTVSMEASFQDFVSGQSQFAPFERVMFRELQNLTSAESWSGNTLSSCMHAMEVNGHDGNTAAAAAATAATGNKYGLRKPQWAVWSFQSSFFDYCRSIAALDARFHRQVQRGLESLLRSPQGRRSEPIESFRQSVRSDSMWYHILHHSKEPSLAASSGSGWIGPMDHHWTVVRWCMRHEWRMFLAEWGDAGPSLCDVESSPFIPGIDTLFI